ncbi:MAG: DUF2934 domain-containing protein [Bryobacteraceae bacterium]
MPHFCGRTHSARDRREALVSDAPRQRAGEPSAPGASTLAPTGAASRGATSVLTGAPTLTGPPPAPGAATARGATSALSGAPARAGATPGSTGPAPTHEQIAALAYSYWEARGRQGGSPEADWRRAEKELRGR